LSVGYADLRFEREQEVEMGGTQGLGWIVAAMLVAAPAGAQPSRQTGAAPPQAGDLMREDLKATGEFRQPTALGQDDPGIRPATAPAEPERALPPPPDQEVPAAAVATPLGPRANELRACRAEVASQRRVRESKVTAGSVLLRWTVQADGTVADAEVVALSDTDPSLLDCVKRRLSTWAFARPAAGAAAHFEHRLTFTGPEPRTAASP
jgi:hypothetical protein